jgi:hypothetical protein
VTRHAARSALLEVRISYPKPAAADQYAAFFGAPVRFGCGYNAIVIPVTLLDTNHKDGDEQLCSILERQAEEGVKQWLSTQGFATRARRILAEQLEATGRTSTPSLVLRASRESL